MNYTLPLKKSHVIELLGGTPAKAAAVLQYKDRTSINKWPSTLSYRDSLMVLGALWLREQAQAQASDQTQASDQAPTPRPARSVKRTRWLSPKGGRA